MNEELAILIEYATTPRRAGEYELKKYLRAAGNKVEDVSDNPQYWDKDIDLIVNDETAIEVKWDALTATTGNLFIELSADVEKNKQGWFNFC
jgi:hypothetical protein